MQRMYAGAAVLAVLFTGTSTAGNPHSGDDRAKAVTGSVTTCNAKGVKLGGDRYGIGAGYADPKTVVRYADGDVGGTYLSIPQVKPGYEVLGVVVQGGEAFNLYRPGTKANPPKGLGELPWMDLHAPLAATGKPAGISQWFVCAKAVPVPAGTAAPAAPAPGAQPGTPSAGPTCDGTGFTLDVAPLPPEDICLGQKRPPP